MYILAQIKLMGACKISTLCLKCIYLLIFLRELIVDLVSPSVLDLQDGCLGGLISRTIPWTFLSHLTVWEITVSERNSAFPPPRGDSPVRNEEKSQFAVSPSSRPVLDTCFHFTAPDDIPSSLVPKQSLRGPLMFCCSYLRKIKEGKNLTLRDTGPFQSLSRPLFPHFAVVEHAGSQREFGCFPPGEL